MSCDLVLSSQTAEHNVTSTISHSPILLRIVRQSISVMASTQKRIARRTVFQALRYIFLVFRCSLVSSADFKEKRFDLQSPRTRLPGQNPRGICDFSRPQCLSLSALRLVSPSHIPPFKSLPVFVSLPQQQLSEDSSERRVNLLHNANHAVYNALTDFDLTIITMPVATTVLALSTLNACTAFVIDLPRKIKSWEGRRQKDYCDRSGTLLRSAST